MRLYGMQVEGSVVSTEGVCVDDDFSSYVAARGAAVLRLAYVLTGNAHDAEDVVQEALSRALSRWKRVSAADDVDAYVRRMVVNAHISWWRRFRRRESPVGVIREGLTSQGADPADSVLSAMTDQRVWLACAGLPRDQRVAVVLRYYEALSYAEIGALVGCAEATARSRVFRGLVVLRDLLGEENRVSDLEERLSDVLRSQSDKAPGVDGLEAHARARYRRRRRRQLALLTVAAVIIACAGAVVTTRLVTSQPDTSSVAGDPQTPHRTQTPQNHTDHRAPAMCALSSLQVTAGSGGGGMGSFHIPIRIRNQADACSLVPSQVALTRDDTGHSKVLGHLSTSDRFNRIPVLATGATITLLANFPEVCPDLHTDLQQTALIGIQIASDHQLLNDAALPKAFAVCGLNNLGVQGPIRNYVRPTP